MDPPPPPQPPPAPPLSSTTTTASAAVTTTPTTTTAAPTTTTTATAAYPDSIDSSPRSRNTDSYLDDPPPPQLASKLRLMCSYGGHIVPRPHDKSLCYVGGDTRIVVVDRHTSLSSLSSRLSNTLLNGRPFTLKYQLPSEDLDSLISVTTDEDLENMIEEYDRTHSSGSNAARPSRLRLFLFPLKPESAQSIGPILESTVKTEDWFFNALNGNTLNRGFSDSASVNCLLGLDDDSVTTNPNSNSNSNADLVGGGGSGGGGGGGGGGREFVGNHKNVKQSGQDVQSVPDSPMLETSSSFGSTSSSPSLANLPPIRVHVDGGGGGGGGGQDQKMMGIEEQFAQISVGGQKQEGVAAGGGDGGFVVLSSPPPLPVSIMPVGSPVMVGGVGGGGDYQGNNNTRVFSDDERSDHGVPVGSAYRKQQQPPAPAQTQQKSGGGSGGAVIDLPSPDSVSSDSSLSNAINRQKQTFVYQDQVVQIPSGVNRVPANANPVDQKITTSDPNVRVQIQDSGYVLQPQFDQQQQQPQQPPQQQQQFIQGGTHYIHHHPPGAVPITTYYPVYATQQQHHQQHHPQLDQQYPVYYVQARQPQAYNLSMQQPSISESGSTIPSSRPQTPPNPSMVPTPASFNAMRNAPIAKPEMAAATMYRTATTGAPQLVQVPNSQHQQQYVGYTQVHHPPQSVAPTSAATATYAYEFSDPAHAQIYYTQPLQPTMPSQYQTMTAGTAVHLPDSSGQLPTDSVKQQQIRTSQAI